MGEIIDFRKKFQEKLKPSKAGLASESEMDPVEVPPEEGPDAGTLDGGEAEQLDSEEGQPQEAEMEAAEETPCKSRNQVDQIIDLAGKQVDFFHTADWETYAIIKSEDRQQTWRVSSKEFKLWIQRLYFTKFGKMPGDAPVRTAINQFDGAGRFKGPTLDVHLRYAGSGGAVYIDLANKAWEQIQVTQEGWKIVPAKDSPVKFKRAKGMLPLCYPGPEAASMEDIGRFFNVKTQDDLVLIVSWLLGAMQPEGPFPILVLQGEQGSAKSTTARLLKDLIDPSTVPLRTLPSCERDLAIASSKMWALSVDNLSRLPIWLSDAFCRLATGGGFGTRTLFTDDTEILFNARRPVILNGISDIATRHDLADRAMIVHLPPISEGLRMAERQLEAAWTGAKPAILKALLDAMVAALRNLNGVQLQGLPRMADFARWITAAEEGLRWSQGTFMKAYEANRMNLIDIALEADIVATAIMDLMKNTQKWSGTASKLYEKLNGLVPDYERKANAWPRGANVLSGRLVRAQTFLRKKGIEIERRKSGERLITIWRTDGADAKPVEPAPAKKAAQSLSHRRLKKAETDKDERMDWETGKFLVPKNQNDDTFEGEI